LESDRIWPPIGYDRDHPFVKALVEVLTRLSDDAYYAVEDFVCFVVEDDKLAAINVPFKRHYPATQSDLIVRVDTIVIFHPALKYSNKALVGLIAHELAHSIIDYPDYQSDEQGADSLARRWGFDEELDILKMEQQHFD
jgi:hypothetical protein